MTGIIGIWGVRFQDLFFSATKKKKKKIINWAQM